MRIARALALLIGTLAPPAHAADEGAIRAAVSRAIPGIESGLAGFSRRRACFSCHHQGLGVMALTAARGHGLAIDEALLRAQVGSIEADLRRGADGHRKGRDLGNGATGAGYAVWALDRAGHAPDEATEAVATYLLAGRGDGWRATCRRPPAEGSPFTATFVALAALRRSTDPGHAGEVADRVAKARDWLVRTPAEDTEGRVFRLRGLETTSATPEAIRAAGDELLDLQDLDGGWPQALGRAPDPYATGSALVALVEAGRLRTSDPAYPRGLRFLLRTQGPDGTWHVATRSRPFQTYFESGFPHGPDQFLSMARHLLGDPGPGGSLAMRDGN